MNLHKFIVILVLLLTASIPQLGSAQNTCAALFSTSQLGTPPETVRIAPKELAQQVSEKITQVTEFQFIQSVAGQVGVRIWLFGGTASGFIHYVKWATMRERGDLRFQGDRFDYDFTNIYRSTQDLDIVVDGTPEQIAQVQSLLVQKYPQFLGSTAAWEVRSLREAKGKPGDIGYKEALLNDFDFLNQNSDSNSTGLIEISKSHEPIVRDLRDWQNSNSQFLSDSAREEISFYKLDRHSQTSRYRAGQNPEIFSVIRFLTKAFQYELKIKEEDFKKIRQIIRDFDVADLKNADARRRLIDIGKKLFIHAVNIEYAWNTIEKLELRKKLLKADRMEEYGSLAFWMNREPLRSRPLGEGTGRTAHELSISMVAHETANFLAYESITRSHTGQPNALISRAGAPSEAAAYGDGFYTRVGTVGAAGTGITIRFRVNPNAREGSDFLMVNNDYLVFLNKNALEVIPESIHMSLFDLTQFVLNDKSFSSSDKALVEKLNRRLSITQATAQELSDTVNTLIKVGEEERKKILEDKLFWPVLMSQANLFSQLSESQIVELYKQYGTNKLFIKALIRSPAMLARTQESRVLRKLISHQFLSFETWSYFQKNSLGLDKNLKELSDSGLTNLLEILEYFKADRRDSTVLDLQPQFKIVAAEILKRLPQSEVIQSWIVRSKRASTQDIVLAIILDPEMLKKFSDRNLIHLHFFAASDISIPELVMRTKENPNFQNYMVESILALKFSYQTAATYLRLVMTDSLSNQNLTKLFLNDKYTGNAAQEAIRRFKQDPEAKTILDREIKIFMATQDFNPESSHLYVVSNLAQIDVFQGYVTPSAMKNSKRWRQFKYTFESTFNTLKAGVGRHRGAQEALTEYAQLALNIINEPPIVDYNHEVDFIFPVLIKDPVFSKQISMRALIQYANVKDMLAHSASVARLRKREEVIKGIEEFFAEKDYSFQFRKYKGGLDLLNQLPQAQEYLTEDRKLNYFIRRWGESKMFDHELRELHVPISFAKINHELHLKQMLKIFERSQFCFESKNSDFKVHDNLIKPYLESAPAGVKNQFAASLVQKLEQRFNILIDMRSASIDKIRGQVYAAFNLELGRILRSTQLKRSEKEEFFAKIGNIWNPSFIKWKEHGAPGSIVTAILKIARERKAKTPKHLVEDAMNFAINQAQAAEFLLLTKQAWYPIKSISETERVLRAYEISQRFHGKPNWTDTHFYKLRSEHFEKAKRHWYSYVMAPETFDLVKDQIGELNLSEEALRTLGFR